MSALHIYPVLLHFIYNNNIGKVWSYECGMHSNPELNAMYAIWVSHVPVYFDEASYWLTYIDIYNYISPTLFMLLAFKYCTDLSIIQVKHTQVPLQQWHDMSYIQCLENPINILGNRSTCWNLAVATCFKTLSCTCFMYCYVSKQDESH